MREGWVGEYSPHMTRDEGVSLTMRRILSGWLLDQENLFASHIPVEAVRRHGKAECRLISGAHEYGGRLYD